jgi:ubiquinone/menaquinone biosynthesis C-methylase UbiE
MFHPNGPTLLELAREGLSSTRGGYDLIASKFDYTPFRTPQPLLDVVGERLRRLGPFSDALDLCCGTGAGLQMLRPLCTGRLIGLDFSPGMLAQARRNLGLENGASNESPRIELREGNALELPFEHEIDVVTCFGAFGHIAQRDEPRFLAGIARALRPGGLFAFVTAPMPPPLSARWILGHGYNALARLRNLLLKPPFEMLYLTFTLEQARRRLEEQRFSVETDEGIFPAPYRRGVLVLARVG